MEPQEFCMTSGIGGVGPLADNKHNKQAIVLVCA